MNTKENVLGHAAFFLQGLVKKILGQDKRNHKFGYNLTSLNQKTNCLCQQNLNSSRG
jgi:hypothetical protein